MTHPRDKYCNYFDANFGHWNDMNDENMVEFYHKVQAESVPKTCAGCGRIVRLRPEYAYCNNCADTLERGGDLA